MWSKPYVAKQQTGCGSHFTVRKVQMIMRKVPRMLLQMFVHVVDEVDLLDCGLGRLLVQRLVWATWSTGTGNESSSGAPKFVPSTEAQAHA